MTDPKRTLWYLKKVAVLAEAGPDGVMINGGRNTRLVPGLLYSVRGPDQTVTDPLTGNVIRRNAGREMGRIEVVEVFPMASRARLISGAAKRGDRLVPLPPAVTQ